MNLKIKLKYEEIQKTMEKSTDEIMFLTNEIITLKEVLSENLKLNSRQDEDTTKLTNKIEILKIIINN